MGVNENYPKLDSDVECQGCFRQVFEGHTSRCDYCEERVCRTCDAENERDGQVKCEACGCLTTRGTE